MRNTATIGRLVTCGLLLVLGGVPAGAQAQTVADDARCLFLSNAFASGAKNPESRQAAASAGAFFLGRLQGRAAPAAIRSAFNQNSTLKIAQAGPIMNACVARAARADAEMRALLAPVAGGR